MELRKLWATLFPQYPQPQTEEHAEIVLHLARTESEAVSTHKRLYSHAWLVERGLPSKLPDILRPRSEHPERVLGVGLAVKSASGNRRRANKLQSKLEYIVHNEFRQSDNSEDVKKKINREIEQWRQFDSS